MWLDTNLTNASKVMLEKFGGKMVAAKPSLVILVFWLDFVTWWCVG